MEKGVARIIYLLERAHSGKCWTGENYDTILSGIPQEFINKKHPGFSNTIHQIVRHLTATDELLIKRLKGINYELQPHEDWPSADQLENIPWSETLQLKNETKVRLIAEIINIKDEDLQFPPFEGFSPWYVQLHGIIEHLHFHMAQIKMMGMYFRRTAGF